MTAARRLDTTRALLDQPAPAEVPGQLPLDHHLAYEEWPDGTFGGIRSPASPWTPEEQAAHRAELETALRTPAA